MPPKSKAKKVIESDSEFDQLASPPPPDPPKRGRGRPKKNPLPVNASDVEDDVLATPRKKKQSPAKRGAKNLKSSEFVEDSDNEGPPPTPSPRKSTAASDKAVVQGAKSGSPTKSAVTYSPTKLSIRKHPLDKRPRYFVQSDSDEGDVKIDTLESSGEEDEGDGDDCEFEGDDDDESIVELTKDDSLYPEPSSPPKVKIESQPAPITPPLKTRGNKGAKRPRQSVTPEKVIESPTKKRKEGKGSAVSEKSNVESKKIFPVVVPPPRSKSTKKPAAPKDDTPDSSDFFSGDEPPPPVKKEDDAKVLKKEDKGKAVKKDESDFFSEDDSGLPSVLDNYAGEIIGYDPDFTRAMGFPPSECQVANPELQDKTLAKKGFYDNLPPLRYIEFEPLQESQGPGLVLFSSWKQLLGSGFNAKQAAAVIAFVSAGRFVNPSRIDPYNSLYGFRHPTPHSTTIWEFCVGKDTAICLTGIMSIDSYLHRRNENLQNSPNYITGIFHTEEFTRFISVMGTVSQNDLLKAHMWADALNFGTKQQSSAAKWSPKPVAMASLPKIPGMFKQASSPSKRAPSSSVPLSKSVVKPLNYGMRIPIYDVRDMVLELNETTFDELAARFPLFEGEIPRCSFVAIAYTAQIHQIGNDYCLFTYALFGLLYGCPVQPVEITRNI